MSKHYIFALWIGMIYNECKKAGFLFYGFEGPGFNRKRGACHGSGYVICQSK